MTVCLLVYILLTKLAKFLFFLVNTKKVSCVFFFNSLLLSLTGSCLSCVWRERLFRTVHASVMIQTLVATRLPFLGPTGLYPNMTLGYPSGSRNGQA